MQIVVTNFYTEGFSKEMFNYQREIIEILLIF